MDALVERAMAFLDTCETCNSLPTLIAEFSKTLSEFGFNYFMMTRLPALGEDAEPYVLAHTWPAEWLDRYRAEQYFWHDPVSHFSLTRAREFSWREAADGSRRTRISRQIFSEAASLGLVDGLGFPMGDPSSVQAVVSLASDAPLDLSPLSRRMLYLVCHYAEMRAVELYDRVSLKFRHLTDREREILRWTANGKSAADTGTILSISERTVKDHLAHAREKLNAVTTTHAVARAIKAREIIL